MTTAPAPAPAPPSPVCDCYIDLPSCLALPILRLPDRRTHQYLECNNVHLSPIIHPILNSNPSFKFNLALLMAMAMAMGIGRPRPPTRRRLLRNAELGRFSRSHTDTDDRQAADGHSVCELPHARPPDFPPPFNSLNRARPSVVRFWAPNGNGNARARFEGRASAGAVTHLAAAAGGRLVLSRVSFLGPFGCCCASVAKKCLTSYKSRETRARGETG